MEKKKKKENILYAQETLYNVSWAYCCSPSSPVIIVLMDSSSKWVENVGECVGSG